MNLNCENCNNPIELSKKQKRKIKSFKGDEITFKCIHCGKIIACKIKGKKFICRILGDNERFQIIGICYVIGSICLGGFLVCLFSIIQNDDLLWTKVFLITIGIIALFFSIGFLLILPKRYKK